MPITHAKVSAVADSGDTSLVRPSDWNAAHVGETIQTATVTLSRAQILTLPTTPVQLVPATEPGLNYSTSPTELPFVLGGYIQINLTGTVYGNISADDTLYRLLVCWGSDFSVAAAEASLRGASNGDNMRARFESPSGGRFWWNLGVLDPDMYRGVDFNDNGLYVAMRNPPGNLTGGHASDTLKATVYYVVIDI